MTIITEHCSLCDSFVHCVAPVSIWLFQFGQRNWIRKLEDPFALLSLLHPGVITKTWFAFLHLHLFSHKYNYLMYVSARDFISKIFKKSVKEKARGRKSKKERCGFRSICSMNMTKLYWGTNACVSNCKMWAPNTKFISLCPSFSFFSPVTVSIIFQ